MLQVKKLVPHAKLPVKASEGAIGMDLFASQDVVIKARKQETVKTGIAISFPEGTYGRVAPRSGLAIKHAIDVGAGVVDVEGHAD